MLYQLMNKDKVVATYEEEKRLDDYRYTEIERLDGYVPYGFVDINDWIDGRQIAKHRTSIERLMRELGLTTRHDFISMARCLALTDTFWMKRADEDISWNDVSLYRNPFDDVIARIAFDGTGMYGRQNSPTSPEFATSGSFAKCWVREGDQVVPKATPTRDSSPIRKCWPQKCCRQRLSTMCPIPSRIFTANLRASARCLLRKRWDLCRPIGSLTVLLMWKTCLPSATRTAATNRSVK